MRHLPHGPPRRRGRPAPAAGAARPRSPGRRPRGGGGAGGGPLPARFRPGDCVGIAWLRRTCGACAFCRGGRENLCERAEFTGYHADGGFAEQALVHEAWAYPLPPEFSDVEAAPLLCAGIIGHRALARALGAAWAGEVDEAMPRRMDGTIIFAPAGELVPRALRGLARGGTVARAGISVSPGPPLDYTADLFHERAVRSVTANTRADGTARLAEAARIPVRLTTTRFPLEEANRALAELRRGGVAGSGVLLTGGGGFRV